MEMVIKIDDEVYKNAKSINWANMRPELVDDWEYIVANGIPLPKGHGRLIDANSTLATAWTNFYKHEDEWEKKDNDYLPFGRMYDQNGFECCQQTIVNAPTIIEADGGGEDEVSD